MIQANRVCVCVCVYESVCERECVCLCVCERHSVCVCLCEYMHLVCGWGNIPEKHADNGNDFRSINPGMHELHFYFETPFRWGSLSSRRVMARLQGFVPCQDAAGEQAWDTEPVLSPSCPHGSGRVLGHL